MPGPQSSHRKRKAGHEPQDLKIDIYHVVLCKIYLISRTPSQVTGVITRTISTRLRTRRLLTKGAISVEGNICIHLYTPVMALASYDTGFRLLDLCVPLHIIVLGISTNGYNLF